MRHPYYPKDLSLPHYSPNTLSSKFILTSFFGVVAALILGAYLISCRKFSGPAPGAFKTRLTFCWFFCCFIIHCFLEGYYVVFQRRLAADNFYLAQVWKEYSLSDSRYLSGDFAVWVIEFFTCFIWGPLSLWAMYGIWNSKSYVPILQFFISFGQCYGVVAYYFTAYLSAFAECRNEPLYFYVYFGLCNLPWFVIPIIIINSSWRWLCKASAAQSTGYGYSQKARKKE